MEHSVSLEALRKYRSCYDSSTLCQVATRAASRTPLSDICYNSQAARKMDHRFSIDIPTLPATDQKSSGRCWIFAALNLLREKAAKDLNLENFQLSQNFFSFYDHLEKANTFLERILETAALPLEDRYVSRLLSEPVGDGGWWEYFVGLCLKYGAVPADAMPETCQSGSTEAMNTLINMQLRKDAASLRREAARGASPEALQADKDAMLSRIYRVLAICLGQPPETFDFEYVDKDRKYHAHRGLTPHSFYETYLGQELSQMVSILNAPIPQVPFYSVSYTRGEESIFGSFQSRRLNLPLEEFKAAVIRQLEAGEPVWFVCDCDYYGSRKEGIWDTALYDYESLLGLELSMDKGELLNYRQTSLNHAMLLTGVNLVEGKPDKWKVQNSWGADTADKGYFILSDAWFDRYVFTATVCRRYLTETQDRLLDQEPLVLEPWNVLA